MTASDPRDASNWSSDDFVIMGLSIRPEAVGAEASEES